MYTTQLTIGNWDWDWDENGMGNESGYRIREVRDVREGDTRENLSPFVAKNEYET